MLNRPRTKNRYFWLNQNKTVIKISIEHWISQERNQRLKWRLPVDWKTPHLLAGGGTKSHKYLWRWCQWRSFDNKLQRRGDSSIVLKQTKVFHVYEENDLALVWSHILLYLVSPYDGTQRMLQRALPFGRCNVVECEVTWQATSYGLGRVARGVHWGTF